MELDKEAKFKKFELSDFEESRFPLEMLPR